VTERLDRIEQKLDRLLYLLGDGKGKLPSEIRREAPFLRKVTTGCYILALLLLLSCGGGGGGGTVTASTYPVAVIGDSLSYNLAPYLPADNFGVSGATIEDMIEHIQGEDLSGYSTIYVMAGINDISAWGLTADEVLIRYAVLLDTIRSKSGARIIVQSTLPMDNLEVNKEVQKLNGQLQAIARKKGCLYIDLWPMFLDLDTGLMVASKTVDGTHLTADGCREWAGYVKAMQ